MVLIYKYTILNSKNNESRQNAISLYYIIIFHKKDFCDNFIYDIF